jgi:hypothetical protein
VAVTFQAPVSPRDIFNQFSSLTMRVLNSRKILIILIVVTQLGSCREQRTASSAGGVFSSTHLFPVGRSSKSVPWNPLKSVIVVLCKVRFAQRAQTKPVAVICERARAEALTRPAWWCASCWHSYLPRSSRRGN